MDKTIESVFIMSWQKKDVIPVLFIYLSLLGLSGKAIYAQIPGVTNGLPKKSKPAVAKKPIAQPAKKRREPTPIYIGAPIVKYKKASSLVVITSPNAEVSLSLFNQQTSFKRTEKVDAEGSLIIDLKPGKYKLSVLLKGYKPNESVIDILPEKIRIAPINLESLASNSTIQPNETETQAVSSATANVEKGPVTESEAWESIKNSSDPKDLRLFLYNFPKGANALKAKQRLEQSVWESAKESENVDELQSYLSEFPRGKYQAPAKTKIQQLKKTNNGNSSISARKTVADKTQPQAKIDNDSKERSIPKENADNQLGGKTAKENSTQAEYTAAGNNLSPNMNPNGSNNIGSNLSDKTISNSSLKSDVNPTVKSPNQNIPANNSSAPITFSAKDYLSKCQENIKSEKLDVALQLCTKAAEMDAKDERTYFLRSKIYTLKANYDLAIDDLSEVINIKPENAMYYNNRGYTFNLKNDYNNAIKDYTSAIKFDPKNPIYYYNRGIAYTKLKGFENAIVDFTTAIELNFAGPMVFNNRGNAFFMNRKYNDAIADYTRAIVLSPKTARFYHNRADAYKARRGKSDLEKAQIDMQIAEDLEKQN